MAQNKKMTIKQKMFADEYIISGNVTESAIKAGYSKKTACVIGSENLNKPNIKAYIDERLKELEDKKIAKQEEVLQYLTSVLRGESKSAQLVVEGTGNGCSEAKIVEKAPEEKDRLKAAELLGKRYGLYTDRVEQDVDQNLTISIDYGDSDED